MNSLIINVKLNVAPILIIILWIIHYDGKTEIQTDMMSQNVSFKISEKAAYCIHVIQIFI